MSPKQVKTIVTDKILKLDQESCKHILECMLEEKREEELKNSKQHADKEKLRQHLMDRHEKSLILEQKCGVKNSTGRSSTSMHLQTQPVPSGQQQSLMMSTNYKENNKDAGNTTVVENGRDPNQKSVMFT